MSDSPAALLVHGLGSDSGTWWHVSDELTSRGWDTTAIDLRGHGASGAAARYALEDYAADLPGHGWDAVVGHSLGGTAAILAARRPGFARALVLIEPVMHIPAGQMAAVEADQLTEFDFDERSLAEAKPHWHPRDRQAKLDALTRVTPHVMSATFADTGVWDVRPAAHALAMPVLVVRGDPAVGTMIEEQDVRDWRAGRPLVEEMVIPGTGHAPHRDAPDATLEAMTGWLARR